jgi:hypothetical protein
MKVIRETVTQGVIAALAATADSSSVLDDLLLLPLLRLD